VINAVLHGLAGPVDDRNYTDVMVPMATNPDDWVAAVAVASYVRTSVGNTGGLVSSSDVKRVRAATTSGKLPWSVAGLEAALPKVLLSDPTWKLSASHNRGGVAGALTLASWSSQTPQAAGTWFQVELPKAETITEVQFESTSVGGRGGRGGGGRGAQTANALAADAPLRKLPARKWSSRTWRSRTESRIPASHSRSSNCDATEPQLLDQDKGKENREGKRDCRAFRNMSPRELV
jgi:hypothetical protein